jgi:hypothetical protein
MRVAVSTAIATFSRVTSRPAQFNPSISSVPSRTQTSITLRFGITTGQNRELGGEV